MRVIVFFFALMVSSLTIGADLKYQEVSDEMQAKLDNYAEYTIKSIRKNGIADFDYNEKSVKQLSKILDEEGPGYSDKAKQMLPTIWGSYLGKAIIKNHGGKWVKLAGSYAVMVNDSHFVFPLEKVAKHINNGSEDSIYGLYVMAGDSKGLAEAIDNPNK